MGAALLLMLCSATPPVPEGRGESLVPPSVHLVDGIDRERELDRQIYDLNTRIRAISTDWPPLALGLSFAGYIFAPFLLIGAPFLLISTFAFPGSNVFFVIGVATLITGIVGLGCLIAGILTGVSSQADNNAERERLLDERRQLEEELKILRRSRGEEVHAPVFLTIAEF